jgi:hypothetical protein
MPVQILGASEQAKITYRLGDLIRFFYLQKNLIQSSAMIFLNRKILKQIFYFQRFFVSLTLRIFYTF